MRVGIYLSSLDPKSGGGFTYEETVINTVSKLMTETHHEFVILFKSDKSDNKIYGKTFQGIKIFKLTSENSLHTISKLIMSSIRRHIFRKVPNKTEKVLIDKYAQQLKLDFLIFLSSHNEPCDTPYLAVVWDLQHRLQPWFPEVSSFGEWKARETLHSEFLQRACFLIPGTNAGKLEIEMFYSIPSARIKILRMPTPSFAGETESKLKTVSQNNYQFSTPFLLYPAAFWAHKNHVSLLYAAKLLKERFALHFDLVFVGSDKGNLEHVRRICHQLGLDAQTHFLGFISRDQLLDLYRKAFALVFVSFFGPDNLPPLEAFALGCPVIAADVNGAAEQLGDAALLVDPKDHNAISEAVKRLAEEAELRERLIRRGRERLNLSSGSDFVRGILSLLDEFEAIRRCWP